MSDVIYYKNNGRKYKKPRIYSVYALIDPFTKDIIYIGHTSNSYDRMRFHVKMGHIQRSGPKLKTYLTRLHSKGEQIVYKELKQFENNNLAKSMEKTLINKLKPICNILLKGE